MLLHPVKNVKPPAEDDPEMEDDLKKLEENVKHMDAAKKENRVERRWPGLGVDGWVGR